MSTMNILPLFTQGAIIEAYNLTDLDAALILAVLAVVALAVYELVHRFRKGSEPAEDDYTDNGSTPDSINEEDGFNKEKTMNVNTKPLNTAQGGLSVAGGCRCLTKELDMIAC